MKCDQPINKSEDDVEKEDETKLAIKKLKKELTSILLSVEKIAEIDLDFDGTTAISSRFC